MEFLLFFPIFTKGIKAKLNELESESDIFPQNEGKVGKSELTPVVKALTNCALVAEVTILAISESCNRNESSELPIVLDRQHTITPEAYG